MNENLKIFNISDLSDRFIYKTESGDTILSIAERFHASPNALIDINGLSEEPKIGQSLIVEKVKGVFYTVKPTESIETICNYDKLKMNVLKIKNRTDFIYVGMKIIV